MPVCLAFAGAQVLHLGFHLAPLDGYSTVDGVTQTLALAALVAAPLIAAAGARGAGGASTVSGED